MIQRLWIPMQQFIDECLNKKHVDNVHIIVNINILKYKI